MDHFFTPIPSTKKTTSTKMNSPTTTSPSSTSQYCFPPHDRPRFPFAFPSEQVGKPMGYPAYPVVIGVNPQPHLLSKMQERRLFDAWTTKIARNKRKMARLRSLSLSKNSASTQVHTSGLSVYGAEADQKTGIKVKRDDHNHSTFCTLDKKRLRFLLKKELKNSDVGSLGRIVLPKKEAEVNLPKLSDKDGIRIVLRDVSSNQEWGMKYKYWSNNKSRMYLLENTVDFVKQNRLVIGDSITLYEDDCKNLYVSIEKVERPVNEPSCRQRYTNRSYNCSNLHSPFRYEARDEEEAISLALLIEQLRHKEELEANSLATLSIGGASSHEAASSFNHIVSSMNQHYQLADR